MPPGVEPDTIQQSESLKDPFPLLGKLATVRAWCRGPSLTPHENPMVSLAEDPEYGMVPCQWVEHEKCRLRVDYSTTSLVGLAQYDFHGKLRKQPAYAPRTRLLFAPDTAQQRLDWEAGWLPRTAGSRQFTSRLVS